MSSTEVVIAHALVPADFVGDLLRDMALPSLDTLSAHGSVTEMRAAHDQLLPAWQGWMFRHHSHVNVALGWSHHFDCPVCPDRLRYVAQPVHFQVGTRGLILEDPAQMQLSAEEATALAKTIDDTLSNASMRRVGGDGAFWLFDAPVDLGLAAAVPELALGEDVLDWLPRGDGAKAWRRLSTEVEMLLHEHPINQQREQRGLPAVSALWIAGDAASQHSTPLDYRSVTGVPGWIAAWPCVPETKNDLICNTKLSGPFLEQDWSSYRNVLIGIDAELKTHLEALRSGAIGRLQVVFTGVGWARQVAISRADLYKFWRRGKAAELLDSPA